MGQIRISEDVRPISDLKSKAAEIVRQTNDSGRPVILTRHGRGVAVMLSVEEYEHLQSSTQRLRLMDALREAEEDVSTGLLIPHDEVAAKWIDDEP
jgi:prevent-host-death family protein